MEKLPLDSSETYLENLYRKKSRITKTLVNLILLILLLIMFFIIANLYGSVIYSDTNKESEEIKFIVHEINNKTCIVARIKQNISIHCN